MKPLNVLLASFSIIVLLLAGTMVVDTMGENEPGITTERTRQAVLLGDAGTWTSVDDGKGTSETVYKTTGYAINLTGANDSYFKSKANVDFSTGENFTVSVWARADPGASTDNMTAVSINGRLLVWWNGSAGNWSAWYFDEGSRNSYRVNVSDNGSQPGNFTNVIVTTNSTSLAIYRNNTLGETQNISVSGISGAPINATNWNGRIEELRTFDEYLDSSLRAALVNSPVEQQPDLSTTSRAMFDQPDKAEQVLLYTSTALTVSNATFSDGFAEQIMDPESLTNDILMDTDYDWDETGPRIRPIAGRELDGAPVVYITYHFDDALSDFTGAWATVTDMASTIPLIAIVLALIVLIRRNQ